MNYVGGPTICTEKYPIWIIFGVGNPNYSENKKKICFDSQKELLIEAHDKYKNKSCKES